MSGKDALTAYVAVALMEAGEKTAAGARRSLPGGQLSGMDDAYTLAITAYAWSWPEAPGRRCL
jgi:hypothetical protein